MTHDARSVANEILRLSISEYNPITNLKVQKMIYFSHGFMLGAHKGPIFYQPVVAWKYGPIVIDVYEALKHHGADNIEEQIKMPGLELVDGMTKIAIDRVYRLMGYLSTSRLVGISHDVNGPWYKVWNNSSSNMPVIPNDLIQKYFTDLFND